MSEQTKTESKKEGDKAVTTTNTANTANATNATNTTNESKKKEETKYINGVDVKKLKENLSKIKADSGYDISLDENTGKITLTIPNGTQYDAAAIQYILKPYVLPDGKASITLNKQATVNLNKLKSTFSANGTNKNIKLANMKEKILTKLTKIPDFDDFQRIHTNALINRLHDIDQEDEIFDRLASSLKLYYNDKNDVIQYMQNNIDTEEVQMALAELNYNYKNLFNSEKQNLANELQARGITRKELGKLSDEEISDTRNLNKIQQTINQSEQQIKQEMREIRKKVQKGWLGWIRDLLGLYGSEYEAQEKLLKQMKEQKNAVQNNIIESSKHANKIFSEKTKSRRTSSKYIEHHQDQAVVDRKNNISTNINLLGIGNTDTSCAPSSGTEGMENSQSAQTLHI